MTPRDETENAPQSPGDRPAPFQPLITATEVAEMLSVPVTWVYAAARSQQLPCVRVGRHVRFKKHIIEAWIDDGGAAPL